jgi:hypothetical protein
MRSRRVAFVVDSRRPPLVLPGPLPDVQSARVRRLFAKRNARDGLMYRKIFPSMYQGTLATHGPWQAIVTFQQMLILCDPTGVVDMTREFISRHTTIPIDIITIGIAALELPDPASRMPGEDGRRIVRLDDHRDWGWQIVNFVHYRDLRTNEDRREYQRKLMQKRRGAAKQASTGGDLLSTGVSNVSNLLAPVSSVSPRKKEEGSKPMVDKSTVDPNFVAFWTVYPKKVARAAASKAWASLRPDSALGSQIVEHVRHRANAPEWRKDAGKYVPNPATFLNGRRFEDEIGTTGRIPGEPLKVQL